MKNLNEKLEAIITKIEENAVDVWEDDLEDTKPVVILDDFKTGLLEDNYSGEKTFSPAETVSYNGWFEELKSLQREVKKELSK